MTNEQKYKTPEERGKAFEEFCRSHDGVCVKCKHHGPYNGPCILRWLADEYKDPKQDLPFILMTELRNGCQVSTICSFDGKEVISCHNILGDDQAYCDSLNAVALAWHKRMNEKDNNEEENA